MSANSPDLDWYHLEMELYLAIKCQAVPWWIRSAYHGLLAIFQGDYLYRTLPRCSYGDKHVCTADRCRLGGKWRE